MRVTALLIHTDNFTGSQNPVVFGAMGVPMFHIMGLHLQLCTPLVGGQPIVVFTPQWPDPPVVPHPQNVYEVGKLAGCTGLVAVPSYIEVLSFLGHLSSYFFGRETHIYQSK